MSNLIKDNIMFCVAPEHAMRIMSDENILQHLQIAHKNGWNINNRYGNNYNSYNALHALCITGKTFHKSTQWLLENGIEKNAKSGNDSTAFTFFVSSIDNYITSDQFIKYAELLKHYGVDLAEKGYDDETPLELYARYCYYKDMQQPIVDYLIENADFENSFLLRKLFNNNQLFTFHNLKNIIAYHNINLKKVIIDECGNTETYFDKIACGLTGSYWKSNYEKITWLHDKLGFELDRYFTYKDFNGTDDNLFHVNLLGFAIHHENSNMFDWVVKRRPEQIKDKFYINDKPYNFLEFCLLCDFRKGAKISLKSMTKEELLDLNMPYLRFLCESNTNPRTLETLEKTYTHLIYKHLKNKYDKTDLSIYKEKKLKI